jgi:hypothetical protein
MEILYLSFKVMSRVRRLGLCAGTGFGQAGFRHVGLCHFVGFKVILEDTQHEKRDEFDQIGDHDSPKSHDGKDVPFLSYAARHQGREKIEKDEKDTPYDRYYHCHKDQPAVWLMIGESPKHCCEDEIGDEYTISIVQIVDDKGGAFPVCEGKDHKTEAPERKRKEQRYLKKPGLGHLLINDVSIAASWIKKNGKVTDTFLAAHRNGEVWTLLFIK